MRVLVVEDEPSMAEAIRHGCAWRRSRQTSPVTATALELLGVNADDFAVLDRDVPGPTGDEIAAQLPAAPPHTGR